MSLFGCNSIKQIDQAIDRVINPWLYSKWAEMGKKFLKIASKVAFKTELDLNDGGAKETTVNWNFDTLAIIGSDEEEVKNFKLLIFDDLERSLIDIRELLGYINNFVEHGRCKVIIVGDTDKIQDKESKDEINKQLFKSFEEKTIGRTFSIQSDVKSAVGTFTDELSMSKFLKKDDVKDLIYKVFTSSEFNNLRVLRQTLMDFNQMLIKLDDEDVVNSSEFLKILLAQYVIAYMEIKSGDRDVFINMPSERQLIMAGATSANKNKIAHIENKYRDLSQSLNYDLLNPFYMSRINLSITTGWDISHFLSQQLKGMLNQSLVQKVTGWYSLNNNDFDNLYREVCDYIMSGEEHTVQEYVSLLEWTSMMDQVSLRKQEQALTDRVRNVLSQKLSECKTNEDLYNLRMMVMQGTRQRDDEPNLLFDSTIKWFYNEFDAAIKNHKDQFYEILENIDEQTVTQLSVLQTNSLPDHSMTYSTIAIYDKIDISIHLNSILHLSNSGRMSYAAFLEDRYHLNYGGQKLECKYMKDITPLDELRNGLKDNLKNYTDVDAFSLKYIIKMIDKILDMAKLPKA